MIDKILNLSKKLIAVSSVKDNCQELKRVIEIAKSQAGEFTCEEFEKDNIPSVLIYNTKVRPKKFKIILNAHLDVVPAKASQYKPYEKNGRLYGRGACDMKTAAAAEILVFKELAGKLSYPLALQMVTDEEIGGFCASRYQIENGVRGDFVIAGEPTDLCVNNKSKGVIWAKIKTQGKTAHGAYLWNGKNAIGKIVPIIKKIEKKYPVPDKEVWQTTINLANIQTNNNAFNKVPDECTLWLDIRYVPEDIKVIKKQINTIVSKSAKIDYSVYEPCQYTQENNKYIISLRKSIEEIIKKSTPVIFKHGAADIRHYNHVGCDGVAFGPIGDGLHSDNEWVNIQSLEDYFFILKDFLLSLE